MLRPDIRVIGEVTNGLDAVALTPEVILLDIGLPGINGIEAARRIVKLMPESKVVFLTQENSGEIMTEALNVGACGYVVKSRAGSDPLPALDAVLQGDQFVGGT
jgi:DNA-binding NarL/FixJ family response regulator